MPDAPPASAAVVDSILPVEEALRRFRADLPRVDTLAGGAASRDELVRRFILALEARDTSAVRQLVLHRAEYAWLYYPASTFAHEPYYQMPQVNWFLSMRDSQKGISRAMDRFGGRPLDFRGYSCPDSAETDGGMRFWHRCTVDVQHDETRKTLRLFGSIVELEGRFKFYSYANDL